jgi:hypothetical protein
MKKIIELEKVNGTYQPKSCINATRSKTIKRQVWYKMDKKELDAFLADVTAELINFARAVETILKVFK